MTFAQLHLVCQGSLLCFFLGPFFFFLLRIPPRTVFVNYQPPVTLFFTSSPPLIFLSYLNTYTQRRHFLSLSPRLHASYTPLPPSSLPHVFLPTPGYRFMDYIIRTTKSFYLHPMTLSLPRPAPPFFSFLLILLFNEQTQIEVS